MLGVISYKCPNCGGDLRFDPKSQRFLCEYCGSDFDQSALSDTKNEEDAAKNDVRQEGARSYSCPSCGAEIITDETTSATFCYYCHNPVVFQGQLLGDYKPDFVIPFAVERKEAVDAFLSYVKRKRFVPKDFFCKEQIEKISGVYFPFWMYSCDAEGDWHGVGRKVRVYQAGDTEYTETKIYDVSRTADFSFEQITRNALNRENKQLVEAVQPFELKGAQEFHYGYLSGFLAQKRDIEKEALYGDVQETVKKSASQMMQGSVKGYTTITKNADHIHVRKENWKYLLVPVWVLTYKGRNGKQYYYAMNGQNKKVAGVLPMDKGKVAAVTFLIFAVVFLILTLGGYFLW